MRVVATIEARMASTRLPGKVMAEAAGVPLLGHLILRLQSCHSVDEVVVATTAGSVDDAIEEYCRSLGVSAFRGDEADVMGRVLAAAESVGGELIVETTGDNPLLDPDIVDLHVETYEANHCDYVSNVVVPTFPDGMDVQVFSVEALKRSEEVAREPLDREHVTRHIRMHPVDFRQLNVIAPRDIHRPDLCVTVDVPEDLEVVRAVLEALYSPIQPFSCRDLVAYLDANPGIAALNGDVPRRGMNA